MSHIFVANPTHQNRIFNYRLPEKDTVRKLEIPPGRQARFPEDFSPEEQASVIEQLVRNGAAQVNDINNGLVAPYGMIFSVSNKPISSDRIDEGREKDIEIRQEVASEMTEAAGLAILATAEGERVGSVKSASLEVTQLGERDEPERGGVDFQAKVSRDVEREQRTKLR